MLDNIRVGSRSQTRAHRKTAETATMASMVCRSQVETTGTDSFLADAEPGHRSLVELSL